MTIANHPFNETAKIWMTTRFHTYYECLVAEPYENRQRQFFHSSDFTMIYVANDQHEAFVKIMGKSRNLDDLR